MFFSGRIVVWVWGMDKLEVLEVHLGSFRRDTFPHLGQLMWSRWMCCCYCCGWGWGFGRVYLQLGFDELGCCETKCLS